MKFPRRFLAILPAVLLLSACGRFGAPKLDVETFNLDNRSGYEAAELINPYVFADRADAPGAMSATDAAITVRETRDNLEKIRRVLQEFDQPIPGVRLHFQLIEADSFRDEDPAIADVVAELKSLFRFEGYRLVGEAMVPVAGGSQGRQSFSQRFLGVEDPVTVEAEARIQRNGTVRLDPVQLLEFRNQLMAATVNITPGQTIVIGGTQSIGYSSENPSENRVFILTVRAEAG
jgi:hypothetical protein